MVGTGGLGFTHPQHFGNGVGMAVGFHGGSGVRCWVWSSAFMRFFLTV
jgi:hypothetical protein